MSEKQTENYNKYIEKQSKKDIKTDEPKKFGLYPAECTSKWTGGDMSQYRGKSWIQPIGTYLVEHDCYIPKQCIHTLYYLYYNIVLVIQKV